MREGGGKAKGASFERSTGKTLSNWLTGGERGDCFTRNVLSGGKFTNSQQKGRKEGIPGDLMAAHPVAYDFLASFLVECKHYADLNWTAFVYDSGDKSFLSQVISKCMSEALRSGLEYMIVAKANRRPDMILTPPRVCQAALATMPRGKIHYHTFAHGRVRVGAMPFAQFLTCDPTEFMKRVRA